MHDPDERWGAALDAIGAHRGDRFGTYAALVARHDEPGRHHHVIEHASEVVDAVLSLHEDGGEWAPAVLAAWFHDAVYDPTAGPGANEGASAVVACDALAALGATRTGIGTVARLICLTASHQPMPGDRAGMVLCDADLSILGADEARYDRYVADVRAEYAHVDDEAWATGRRAVLRGFLDRAQIFSTDHGRGRWEGAARTNISRELSSFD